MRRGLALSVKNHSPLNNPKLLVQTNDEKVHRICYLLYDMTPKNMQHVSLSNNECYKLRLQICTLSLDLSLQKLSLSTYSSVRTSTLSLDV